MPYSYPMSLVDFWDSLPMEKITFDAPGQFETNETGGGAVITADLAPMLWQGEIRLGDMLQHEAALPETRLDVLQVTGRTFHAYDRRRPGPLNDLTGAILGASTPTIHTLVGNNLEMRLQDLPVGYNLSIGDYLAFNYGAFPARIAPAGQQSGPGASGWRDLSLSGASSYPTGCVGGHCCHARPGFLHCCADTQISLEGRDVSHRDTEHVLSFQADVILMRQYTAQEIAYLQNRKGFLCRSLIWVQPRDRATGLRVNMYFWSGEEDRSFVIAGSTRVYKGGGGLKSVDPIVMQAGLVVRMQRVILAPLFAEVALLLRGYDTFRAPVQIHRAMFDPETGNLIADPRRVWKGLTNRAPIQTPAIGGESKAELTLSIASESLTHGLTLTRSDEGQRQRGGDRFYRYKDVTGQVACSWGETRA